MCLACWCDVRGDPITFAGTALVNGEFKEIKKSDYDGKWVVLFFYPMDFTFVVRV